MTDPAAIAAVQPVRPSAIKFAIRYSDDSGDELAVSFDRHDRYHEGMIVITGVDLVEVAPDNLDWLISSLCALRAALHDDTVRGEGEK